MKTLFSAILMVVFAIGIHAQSRLENAKKQASQNKELILLNFSGSDWCIPCIKLHKNIIETDEFKKLESENFIVYINADFPRNKKNQLSSELKKENASLADQYNQKGLFPYTLLLNSEGKVLKSWEGLPSEDALAFSKEIKSIKENQK
ncbi:MULTISPECIES: thioredoxin family protein [Chryseobacterium]|uniref:Thioredoxin family protein n=1 Tax=Chryseobacterium cucumeris TaxID=1813611 RepID=A0ABX9X7Y7_9FLAO|nr:MULTISPECIES: thioredoxin family protein [Chryseobacterium]MDH5033462.1 thioredoxin family protein [Chryseobacterium cucumeris]QWT87046.1 thioredoxin family protein [Chryseobacterium sp. PCH239]RKE81253.1 thioredoxin-like protein [Chryseobacterium sp. AG363]ROH94199.1 thioredoxin family protein [Chryseobacterium cucumeris]WFB68300.1 thioredoxin family protein [Chryseobacterium sp. WX]